jgi:DNA ligase 1
VYFRPHEVWEIRGADITLSPVSSAAIGQIVRSKGLSLRFPRFIRTRDDKSIEQASTVGFLINIYKQQQGGGKAAFDGDDLVDVGWESEVSEVIEEEEEEDVSY